VALVRIEVSEQFIASVIRMTRRIFFRSVLQLRFTAKFVPSWLIIFTLIMEAICPSETPVLTGAARRHIPESDILHESGLLLETTRCVRDLM
jgi:hypothetical protein